MRQFRVVLLSGLLFTFALQAGLPNPEGKSQGRICAERLNALASEMLGTQVLMRWIGGQNDGVRFGWLRLSNRSLTQLISISRLPPNSEPSIRSLFDSLILNGDTLAETYADDPAFLTHRAVTTLLGLGHNPALYAAFVPRDVTDCFPYKTEALHLHHQDNFLFVDDRELGKHSVQCRPGARLERSLEVILLNEMALGHDNIFLHQWIADLLAAITRWIDLETISGAVNKASRGKLNLEGVAAVDDAGTVTLASTYLGLYTEPRAEAVRSWVLHKLRGGDWRQTWQYGQHRALTGVSAYSDKAVVTPYLQLPNGIYEDHTVPVDVHLNQ